MKIQISKKITGYSIITLVFLACGYGWKGLIGAGIMAGMILGFILLWFAVKWIFAE